jgi:nitrogen-specific signal transduction histidine kinase
MAAPQPVLVEECVYGESRPALEVSIRELAHNLRQPLGAIEAIAYYLEMTLPAEQIEARGHLLRLQRLVEESSMILQNAVRATRS